MTTGLAEPTADLGSEELLYEIAVPSIYYSVSGAEGISGIRPTGGKFANHTSGLECKFGAEVAKASAGIKRSDANEIVKQIIPKFEGKLMHAPKGKTFTECFDLRTLKPTEEWLTIYEKVWNDLIDLGIKKDKL
jgi:methylamine--corrinoid protein Co-methyltransferase